MSEKPFVRLALRPSSQASVPKVSSLGLGGLGVHQQRFKYSGILSRRVYNPNPRVILVLVLICETV